LALGLLLVLKVGVLELCTDIKSNSKLIMGTCMIFRADKLEDGWTIDGVSASDDDGIADLSD